METRSVDLIHLQNVGRSFKLRSENSLKESMVNLFAGRKRTQMFHALKDVNLTVAAGSTLGLIGHNGSGKSTLLKLIGGILEPSQGRILRRGSLVALLELGAGFHPDLTGRENVYLNASILGLTKAEIDEKFDAILEFSGIGDFIDTQVKFYSSGMYVRIAFAVAVNVDPDILLVDEVLAVGDELYQQKCMEKIKEFQRDGRTIIIVSHSADQIRNLCDSVVLLDQGVPIFYGDPEEGIQKLRESLIQREGPVIDQIDSIATIRDLNVRILSSEGTEQKKLSTNSGFILEAQFEAEALPDDEVLLEMSIISASGHSFVCSAESSESVPLPSKDGQYSVAFSISKAWVLPVGPYSVKVKLMSVTGEVLHEGSFPNCFELTSKHESALTRPFIEGQFVIGFDE